jgi:uncharacterized DUF497 family protein
MNLEWSEDKNELLIGGRGVSFEMVEQAILEGKIIKIAKNNSAKFPSQYMLYIELKGYVHCVPFVHKQDVIFLKTIYPSRKADRLYREGRL